MSFLDILNGITKNSSVGNVGANGTQQLNLNQPSELALPGAGGDYFGSNSGLPKPLNPNTSTGGFFDGFDFQDAGSLFGGAASLGELYLNYQNFLTGQDQLDFATQAYNRDLENNNIVAQDELNHKRIMQGASGPTPQLNSTPITV